MLAMPTNMEISPSTSDWLYITLCMRECVCVLKPVDAGDDAFWSQFWSESVTCVQDVFALIPAAEIRALREESPSNLATLCYKAVEKLVQASEAGCHSQKEEQMGGL